MEENKPLVTETEYPDSDTDIISGDGTPIIDTSDQNTNAAKEESATSKSDAEENTGDSSSNNTEENGAGENTTTEIVTDPANDPATLESALLVSTYAALNKLAEYVPTEYVNNSEPDIDAEHLNNTEQGLLRVTNLLNGAVDVINDLQTTVANQASAIETLNSKTGAYTNEYENFTETVLGKYVQYSFYGRQWTFSNLPAPNGNTSVSFVVSLVGSKISIAHMNIDTDGRVSLYDQDWSEISASSDILIRGTIGYYLKIQ